MGALHINGQKTTGLDITLAEGVFIDADNLIFSYTINSGSISQTEYSYTATEDCYVRFMTCTPGANQMTKIFIDGVEIFRIQNTSIDEIFSNSCLLKKGQVITLSNIGSYTGIGVYGIQQGTIEGKLQPVIYSEEEREVGVWTDGKPLYEKTLIGQMTAGGDTDVDLSSLNIDNFILVNASAERINTNAGIIIYSYAGIDANVNPSNPNLLRFNFKFYKQSKILKVTSYTVSTAEENVGNYIAVIQYTKTTDTAGAGTWTPDGAYAHHYSTDEKVVGTWIDGSTLYEKTYDLGQDVTIKYNEWTEVNATKPNGISKYINIFGTQDDGTGVVLTGANPANATFSNIRLSTRRFQDESVRWFTIQYIKTS